MDVLKTKPRKSENLRGFPPFLAVFVPYHDGLRRLGRDDTAHVTGVIADQFDAK